MDNPLGARNELAWSEGKWCGNSGHFPKFCMFVGDLRLYHKPMTLCGKNLALLLGTKFISQKNDIFVNARTLRYFAHMATPQTEEALVPYRLMKTLLYLGFEYNVKVILFILGYSTIFEVWLLFCGEWEKLLMPLYFSCISSSPHECQYDLWKAHTSLFYGEESIAFIAEFIDFVERHNVIYEDVIMRIFALSMDKHARRWYYSLPPKSISSFHGFS